MTAGNIRSITSGKTNSISFFNKTGLVKLSERISRDGKSVFLGSGAEVRGLTPRRPTKYLHHAIHDFLNKLYLCFMKKQPTQFDYSTLGSYMLPKGILDSFEINRIEDEDLGIKDETGTEIRVLHIYR